MKPPAPPDDVVRPPGVAEDAILKAYRVPPECASMRVDVFIQSQLRNTSRTRARAIVQNCAHAPGGRRLKPSDRVRAEDYVLLWRPPFDEIDDEADLVVLFEDEHLLVIDKPPLMAVHPTARHHHATVLMQLKRMRPELDLALVHRIDRETSGVLLLAKTKLADREFKRLLERRTLDHTGKKASTMDKYYLAITWGQPRPGLIDKPVEVDIDNPLRVKMRIASPGCGMPARTSVEVLETLDKYALVRCHLHTGRQHQIRLHLASEGTPIVGDKLYGPNERYLADAADQQLTDQALAELELPRHALHAHRYELTHALTGVPLRLESPLPEDLAAFWRARAAN